MDRSDLLTWEGIRSLAHCEALNLGPEMRLAQTDLARPVIKWRHQYHWAHRVVPRVPRAGEIVHARVAWQAPWRAQILAAVTEPIVIVSSFYDYLIQDHATAEIFQHGSPVAHWFAVQANTTHPQLTAMPIGIEGSMVPHIQAGVGRTERDILLYLNFQERSLERHRLWKRFAPLPWVTADRWAPGGEAHYVAQLGRSKFVLSPPGNGWDCYRTYEAIAMGAIPIVLRRRPISNVCETLPVLLVDDWAEVTPARLRAEWEHRQPKDTRTLTMTYWRERIQGMAKSVM